MKFNHNKMGELFMVPDAEIPGIAFLMEDQPRLDGILSDVASYVKPYPEILFLEFIENSHATKCDA